MITQFLKLVTFLLFWTIDPLQLQPLNDIKSCNEGKCDGEDEADAKEVEP